MMWQARFPRLQARAAAVSNAVPGCAGVGREGARGGTGQGGSRGGGVAGQGSGGWKHGLGGREGVGWGEGLRARATCFLFCFPSVLL